jgi:glyoxylase-like metal-dependent hydrolase (beta-lactamase superfamily II)
MSGLKAVVVPVTPFQQNCSILWDEAIGAAAVVDPGGEVERILAAVDKLGVRPEKILLTHGHIDHAGGAADLKAALQERAGGVPVPIEGPDERDRFLLQGLAEQGRMYGLPGGAKDVLPDRWLAEGDEVTVGAHAFQVLHCPGHTPGHLVFVNGALKLAVVGDVLFRGSVGRTDFPYGDTEALLRSVRDKLFPLGDDVAFLCGHGPGSTIGAERHGNPFVREA